MILMMGSKEEDVPTEPVVKPVFVEDMNETELATAVSSTFMPGHFIHLSFRQTPISKFVLQYASWLLFDTLYVGTH